MNLMEKNSKGLVDYCLRQLGRPYWYGTFGQKATRQLYLNRKKAYPKYYTATDYEEQFGQKVHDCIGLVKGYMWTDDADSTNYVYQKGFPDVSADMQYNRATRKGTISTLPEIPGALVFMAGHVGVYIGDGWVIEARGHKFGVVKTRLIERPWKRWALIDEIQYLV
jgi:cell wall-associated NlpC family hydrolase